MEENKEILQPAAGKKPLISDKAIYITIAVIIGLMLTFTVMVPKIITYIFTGDKKAALQTSSLIEAIAVSADKNSGKLINLIKTDKYSARQLESKLIRNYENQNKIFDALPEEIRNKTFESDGEKQAFFEGAAVGIFENLKGKPGDEKELREYIAYKTLAFLITEENMIRKELSSQKKP